MKKYIFLVLVSMLVVLMLLYFYDKKEVVLNREYRDNYVYMEYPYFNNRSIDMYINNYLNSLIKDNYNNYFIDYDYRVDEDDIYLTMYKYRFYNKVVSNDVDSFLISLSDNSIVKVSGYDNDTNYRYHQKKIDKSKPMVALTFDDGPGINTNKVLNILEKYNIKATFFLLGVNINNNEDIVKRIDDMGMEIGNHMYSHKVATSLDNDSVLNEITKVDKMVFEVIHDYPTLVRPSYGTFNKRIRSIVDRPIIIWNIDTMDWKYHNSRMISRRVLNKVNDGDIILMHDIYSATANSLEIIIPKLLDKGYQFVTVSQLFDYKNIDLFKGKVYGRAK